MNEHDPTARPDHPPLRRPARIVFWALPLLAALGLVLAGSLSRAQEDDYGYGEEVAPAEAAPAAPVVDSTAPAPAGKGRDAANRFPEATFDVVSPGEHEAYNQRYRLLVRGERVYNIHCVGCHGAEGDGNGPAAPRLIVKPRDFTSGVFKFRSTVAGTLPMEEDLHRTINRGLARVSMPAFPLIPEQDKTALVEYVKSFYPRWEEEKSRRERVFVPIPPEDLASDERIGRGNMVYVAMGCGKCHGVDGAGAGATETEYTDAWGNKQKAFNFTRGRLKNGDTPADIYRTFHTGLNSIMPQYGGTTLALVSAESLEGKLELVPEGQRERITRYQDQFPAATSEVFAQGQAEQEQLGVRNSWDLVAFVLSLRQERTYGPILGGAGGGSLDSVSKAMNSDE